MKRFKDKTVIVTGAGSGIGRATAIRFAHEGANVVMVGRTHATLEDTAAQLPQDHTFIHADNHLTVTCDITDLKQVKSMVNHVIDKFDTIDVVVNSVNKSIQGKITELTDEAWRAAVDVNIHGTFYICQATMPALIKSKGNIINIASSSGLLSTHPDPNKEANSSTKSSVLNLTRTLALDHAADAVRVNAVSPMQMLESDSSNDSNVDALQFAAQVPLGHLATPEDIAAGIMFLASSDAAMITGINLPIDGGMSTPNS